MLSSPTNCSLLRFFFFTEPSAAPNITKLINTSSTSLLVTWLHNIPPEHYNGVFLGYRVRWTEEPHANDSGSVEFGSDVNSYNIKAEPHANDSGSVEFGTHVNSYNITDLKKYQSYRVYVAGRSHGGVGVENYEEARTGEDGKQV